ncbi:hypothetical protein GLYMA_03G049901v4 [Glycine max]|nr:hypothetical protein GLYMA_03G049901v4 [Glycine max]
MLRLGGFPKSTTARNMAGSSSLSMSLTRTELLSMPLIW